MTYFSYNLINHFGYTNSRISDSTIREINETKNPLVKRKKIRKKWNLPYKSTIVLPLISENIEHDQYYLEGIICIDSKKKNTFDRRVDIDILSLVSISLAQKYSLLKNVS